MKYWVTCRIYPVVTVEAANELEAEEKVRWMDWAEIANDETLGDCEIGFCGVEEARPQPEPVMLSPADQRPPYDQDDAEAFPPSA